MDLFEAAIDAARRGLHVFPVWGVRDGECLCMRAAACDPKHRGKHPLTARGFKDATTDEDRISAWWEQYPEANLAIATGAVSRLVVLDADGPEGKASLLTLRTPATTWRSQTGREAGGWHQFFAHPGVSIGNRTGLRPGLDVRGDGGYVILPPSLHVSGNRYRWLVSPEDLRIEPLPEHVLPLLLAHPPVRPTGANGTMFIAEGTRNDTLFRLARSLHAKGMSDEAIGAALRAENIARCQPPLAEREVLDIARRAAAEPDRPDFAERPTALPRPRGRPAARLVDALELLRAPDEARPPSLIGNGYLPRGSLAITGGAPKVSKSMLALNKALAVATGTPWLCWPVTRARVLVLQAEIPSDELKARLRRMTISLTRPLERGWLSLVTYRGLALDQDDGRDTIHSLIEDAQAEYAVIDPLARFYSGDENSTRDMGRAVAGMDALIQATGASLEVVHHTGKPSALDAREGGHRLRGSSALYAAADTIAILERTGQERFRLSVELRHGPEPQPLALCRTESLWLAVAGPPSELLAVASTVATLPLRYGQLVKALIADQGTSEATAERRIKDASKLGLIAKNPDGAYRATLTNPHYRAEGEVTA